MNGSDIPACISIMKHKFVTRNIGLDGLIAQLNIKGVSCVHKPRLILWTTAYSLAEFASLPKLPIGSLKVQHKLLHIIALITKSQQLYNTSFKMKSHELCHLSKVAHQVAFVLHRCNNERIREWIRRVTSFIHLICLAVAGQVCSWNSEKGQLIYQSALFSAITYFPLANKKCVHYQPGPCPPKAACAAV